MTDITIVTAFFDIGREQYQKLSRDNSLYFKQFEHWAMIKNKVVAFCGSKEHKEQIEAIRMKNGLLDKTTVFIIDDITELFPGIYEKMVEISTDPYFENFRVLKNILSNKPKYDLVNHLKIYFLELARTRLDITDQIAWVDFSFDHGGAYYSDRLDFDFEWHYDCNGKAHFFYEEELDKRPVFEMIRTVKPDPMLGAMFIIPAGSVERLWKSYLDCIHSMLDMGMIDDDQPILLMNYRKNKDICVAIKCENCEQLRLCGGEHMTYTAPKRQFKHLRRIKRMFTKRIEIFIYHSLDKKILLRTRD